MGNTIDFAITPFWSVIEQIRNRIRSRLKDTFDRDVIDTASICAVELAENAIKYGESVPDMQYIRFKLAHGADAIEVRVSNGVVKKFDLQIVTSIIDKINNGADPEQLYLDRLAELTADRTIVKSQLGLFRIANETGFGLKYDLDGDTLTITATRKVQP